jgi:antitoxin (DNA-binding transcriptional repressor) of toxin-antitoxin stability system
MFNRCRSGGLRFWIGSLAGEEVEVMQQEKVIAKVVPVTSKAVAQPDFLARAKAIWGERPTGEPLSAIVTGARGGPP